MGNKMQFLLDYYQYFNNIDNNDYTDDLNLYNQFIKNSKNGSIVMTEGLITTYPVDKSIDIINKRFPEILGEIEPDGEIYISGNFRELINYLPLFNNLGYFISTVEIKPGEWITNFNEDDIPTSLYLEAKYDIKISDINIPKRLYHASPLKFEYKILHNGLIMKSGNKISIHPERIYLTENILTAKIFATNLKKEYSKYFKDGCIIYSINTRNIHDLYSDVNLRNSGYYTTNNIPPEDIKIAFRSKQTDLDK